MKVTNENPKTMIPVTIDGNRLEVPEGSTVLQAARMSGIYVPTLCYLDMLPDYGGCRLCMVQIKNMKGFPTACTTPVSRDMEVLTKTEELQSLRREILELILSEHPYTCLVCRDKGDCIQYMHTTRKAGVTTGCNFCTNNGDCELQELVDYLELKEIRFPIAYRHVQPVRDNPFYTLDYNLCILCGRCVRICNEERHSEVLAFVQRGNATLVGTAFGETQQQAGCEYCGACVDVCPTGSISEKIGAWSGIPDHSTETICTLCSVGCAMNVNTRHHRIANVGPAPGKRTAPHQLCVRGKFVPPDLVHHPMRITSPLIRKENRWVEVSWEEALQHTAECLQQITGNHFGIIGQAQDTLENNYILQKFARTVVHSNHVDLFGSYPDNDLISNIYRYHRQEAPVKMDDITSADTILVMGSRAFLSHPLVENRIRKAYKKGVTVIDVNSRSSRTTSFSSLHLTYDPGGEYGSLLTLLAGLSGALKGPSSREVMKQLKPFKLNKISGGGGLSRQEHRSLQDILLNARDLIIIAGDGIFRSGEGAMIFNALMNIRKLLRGHCRILFLLDEGNRYGATLAGMHPGYLGGFDKVNDSVAVTKWKHQWNTALNRHPGFSSDEMIKNINKDGIASLFVVGDIPPHSSLEGLQFFVQHNLFLTKTSDYAHVFLPLTSLSEDAGHVVNLEGELKKMIRVMPPSGGARPAWQMIAGVADKMGIPGFEISEPGEIMKEMESTIDLTFSHGGKEIKRLTLEPVIAGHGDDGFSLLVEPNTFHYLGNSLASLMPDMKAIRHEGVLFVSPSLSGELGLQDHEQVLVETSCGNLIAEIRTDHEMENRTAGFYPCLEQYSMLTDGLNMNRNHLSVKIKPLQNG